MAHCCGRGTASPPRDYLLGLCDQLDALDLPRESLRQVRLDSAFLLADRTKSLPDLAFAERLEAMRSRAKTPGPAQNPPPYRWEAGISEWVSVSPVTSTRVRPRRRWTDGIASGGRGAKRKTASAMAMAGLRRSASSETDGALHLAPETEHRGTTTRTNCAWISRLARAAVLPAWPEKRAAHGVLPRADVRPRVA